MNKQPNNVTQTQIPEPGQPPAEPPAGAKKAENEGDGEIMIPKSRFDEVNQKAKTLAETIAEYEREASEREAAEVAAEQTRMEEQGQFKELAMKAKADMETLKASYETLAEQAKRMEAALQTYLEKEVADVPEWVTPLLEKFDVTERLAWLVENKSQWAKHNGGPPPSPRPDGKPGMDDEERRKRAFRIRL